MIKYEIFDLLTKSRKNAKKLKKDVFDKYMEDYIYQDFDYLSFNHIFKELNNQITFEILNNSNQPLYKEDKNKKEHQNNLFFELILSVDYWYITMLIRRYGEEALDDRYIADSYYYTLYAIKVFILKDLDFWNKLSKHYYFLISNDKNMFIELMDIIGGNDLFFLFIDTLQCYRLNYKELMDDGTIKERMDRCILMLEDSYKIMKSLINMSYESGKFVFKINRFGVERY